MKKKTIIYILIAIVIIGVIIAFIFLNQNKQDNKANGENTNAESTVNNSLTPKELTEQDKSIFNSNFNIYRGSDVDSMQVKYLISSIKYSNENSSVRKIDLIINGKESTNSSEIVATSTYSVKFEYDDNGLICKAIVNENK